MMNWLILKPVEDRLFRKRVLWSDERKNNETAEKHRMAESIPD